MTSPVDLDRLVAFLNTLHRPDGDDVLADDRASGWVRERAGRVTAPDPATGQALERLRELREGLRQLCAANNGLRMDVTALRRGADTARSLPMVVDLGDRHLAPRLQAPPGSDAVERVMAAVVTDYLTARAEGSWSRVKACAAPECRRVYLDSSRNRSRRWCDMADCGNRAKNRRWRARHA